LKEEVLLVRLEVNRRQKNKFKKSFSDLHFLSEIVLI
jgi:hypothetical protein